MNSQPQPTPNADALEQADAVLQRYFIAEIPKHWPRVPTVAPLRRRAFALSHRHLALAASFFIAIGCWWACGLSRGMVSDSKPAIRSEGGSATEALHGHRHPLKTNASAPQDKPLQPAAAVDK